MSRYLLQHLLEETSSKYPDKNAIVSGQDTITYKSLDEKSCCLANMLFNMGFKPRNVVGVYLPKSIEAIISVFAILKAGGAYIPLDSCYSPQARINKIISLSEMEYVISNTLQWKSMLDSLGDDKAMLEKIKVIFLDKLDFPGKSVTLEPVGIDFGENCFYYDESMIHVSLQSTNITDTDLAYILYTSGSTGTPKGVMLTHLNAMTFINWSLSYFKPKGNDIFSNFAPLHFDLSIFDIYVSIAAGGCLNIVPFQISSNPRALLEWISKSKITYMYSVPSVWVSILNYTNIKQDDLPELKKVLFAGEVFPPKYLNKLMEILPQASFYNLYGPTETNVCMYYHVKSRDEVNDRPVPIGSACENTEILVLNENDLPVNEGEEGELLVRGSIVTQGYYKERERTLSAFRRSPLGIHNGKLFYKTGDIVRKCADDIYEFVGRKDFMVKCSGFRVELQEIEHALYQNETIEEAVVVPVTSCRKDTVSICAVVKMREGSSFSVSGIKNFLVGILPKYMIPESIECIEELPKNSNGKVDRVKIAQLFSC
ncbi:MAG TPA: amino acid adenylation domain-containing protein [Ruminiclostridium sp.]|nr:amino acid adenylation domain-containing protein [Ruminiclostridium sp.]